MGYSKGHDKLLFVVGVHRVMADRLQIVIQHPSTCPGKGAARDHYKTFHRWRLALEKLEQCGVVLTQVERERLIEKGQAVERAIR